MRSRDNIPPCHTWIIQPVACARLTLVHMKNIRLSKPEIISSCHHSPQI